MRLVFLGMIALALAPAVRADRYVIQIGDLPPTYVGDATEYCTALEPQSGMTPPTAKSLSALTVPATVARPGVTVTPESVGLASRVATEVPQRQPGEQLDTTELIEPPTTPPTAEFRDQLARIYSITAPDEIDAIWMWCEREPADLPFGSRVGNAVVRHILALDKPLAGDSTARPDLLKPNATRGTVRANNGVSIRGQPWGAGTGNNIPTGASLEIIPPADGPWYQVRSASGTGWVCGLWLDLQ